LNYDTEAKIMTLPSKIFIKLIVKYFKDEMKCVLECIEH
jgi:hypothetical protein